MKPTNFLFLILFLLTALMSRAQETGTFTCAAMNVDGMPKSIKVAGFYSVELNPDAREAEGATAVGKKIKGKGWDFFGVSEDFNYNNELTAQLTGYSQGTHRGGIPTSPGFDILGSFLAQKSPLFNTDGLNFFWNSKVTVSGERWQQWNTHYGYTNDGADGMIAKGYRMYQVTVATGITLDVYILHMEAGAHEKDYASREAQYTQLANDILNNNIGNSVIVMGDFNSHYTDDRLKELFVDPILANSRFHLYDAWVLRNHSKVYPPYHGSSVADEAIDKLFYINVDGGSCKLSITDYKIDTDFMDASGTPLSDHYPVVSSFKWTRQHYEPQYSLGDTNKDGVIDVSDVTTLINMVLGSIPVDKTVADMDGNGTVDVSDVTMLINKILS